jgi:hypothetical protein
MSLYPPQLPKKYQDKQFWNAVALYQWKRLPLCLKKQAGGKVSVAWMNRWIDTEFLPIEPIRIEIDTACPATLFDIDFRQNNWYEKLLDDLAAACPELTNVDIITPRRMGMICLKDVVNFDALIESSIKQEKFTVKTRTSERQQYAPPVPLAPGVANIPTAVKNTSNAIAVALDDITKKTLERLTNKLFKATSTMEKKWPKRVKELMKPRAALKFVRTTIYQREYVTASQLQMLGVPNVETFLRQTADNVKVASNETWKLFAKQQKVSIEVLRSTFMKFFNVLELKNWLSLFLNYRASMNLLVNPDTGMINRNIELGAPNLRLTASASIDSHLTDRKMHRPMNRAAYIGKCHGQHHSKWYYIHKAEEERTGLRLEADLGAKLYNQQNRPIGSSFWLSSVAPGSEITINLSEHIPKMKEEFQFVIQCFVPKKGTKKGLCIYQIETANLEQQVYLTVPAHLNIRKMVIDVYCVTSKKVRRVNRWKLKINHPKRGSTYDTTDLTPMKNFFLFVLKSDFKTKMGQIKSFTLIDREKGLFLNEPKTGGFFQFKRLKTGAPQQQVSMGSGISLAVQGAPFINGDQRVPVESLKAEREIIDQIRKMESNLHRKPLVTNSNFSSSSSSSSSKTSTSSSLLPPISSSPNTYEEIVIEDPTQQETLFSLKLGYVYSGFTIVALKDVQVPIYEEIPGYKPTPTSQRYTAKMVYEFKEGESYVYSSKQEIVEAVKLLNLLSNHASYPGNAPGFENFLIFLYNEKYQKYEKLSEEDKKNALKRPSDQSLIYINSSKKLEIPVSSSDRYLSYEPHSFYVVSNNVISILNTYAAEQNVQPGEIYGIGLQMPSSKNPDEESRKGNIEFPMEVLGDVNNICFISPLQQTVSYANIEGNEPIRFVSKTKKLYTSTIYADVKTQISSNEIVLQSFFNSMATSQSSTGGTVIMKNLVFFKNLNDARRYKELSEEKQIEATQQDPDKTVLYFGGLDDFDGKDYVLTPYTFYLISKNVVDALDDYNRNTDNIPKIFVADIKFALFRSESSSSGTVGARLTSRPNAITDKLIRPSDLLDVIHSFKQSNKLDGATYDKYKTLIHRASSQGISFYMATRPANWADDGKFLTMVNKNVAVHSKRKAVYFFYTMLQDNVAMALKSMVKKEVIPSLAEFEKILVAAGMELSDTPIEARYQGKKGYRFQIALAPSERSFMLDGVRSSDTLSEFRSKVWNAVKVAYPDIQQYGDDAGVMCLSIMDYNGDEIWFEEVGDNSVESVFPSSSIQYNITAQVHKLIVIVLPQKRLMKPLPFHTLPGDVVAAFSVQNATKQTDKSTANVEVYNALPKPTTVVLEVDGTAKRFKYTPGMQVKDLVGDNDALLERMMPILYQNVVDNQDAVFYEGSGTLVFKVDMAAPSSSSSSSTSSQDGYQESSRRLEFEMNVPKSIWRTNLLDKYSGSFIYLQYPDWFLKRQSDLFDRTLVHATHTLIPIPIEIKYGNGNVLLIPKGNANARETTNVRGEKVISLDLWGSQTKLSVVHFVEKKDKQFGSFWHVYCANTAKSVWLYGSLYDPSREIEFARTVKGFQLPNLASKDYPTLLLFQVPIQSDGTIVPTPYTEIYRYVVDDIDGKLQNSIDQQRLDANLIVRISAKK